MPIVNSTISVTSANFDTEGAGENSTDSARVSQHGTNGVGRQVNL